MYTHTHQIRLRCQIYAGQDQSSGQNSSIGIRHGPVDRSEAALANALRLAGIVRPGASQMSRLRRSGTEERSAIPQMHDTGVSLRSLFRVLERRRRAVLCLRRHRRDDRRRYGRIYDVTIIRY